MKITGEVKECFLVNGNNVLSTKDVYSYMHKVDPMYDNKDAHHLIRVTQQHLKRTGFIEHVGFNQWKKR